MPRRPQQPFNCNPLAELTRQLLFAPPSKRIAQLKRAERLHDETRLDSAYPVEYLIYRITRYRPEAADESMLLVGQAVLPDLRLMIDQLSRSVDLPLDDEPAATIDELAQRMNVSAKTVHRWRKAGLRWRWVTPAEGGQKYIVITDTAASGFIEHNSDRVRRATQYSTMSPADREQVIAHARRIVESSATPPTLNRVATQIAAETGRSLETIRLTLEKHERASPKQSLFTHSDRPLTPRQKHLIERARRRGIPVSRIADHLGRSRHTIHRILRQRRAAIARHIDLRYIHSPTFDRDDADEVILRRPVEDIAIAHPATYENDTDSSAGIADFDAPTPPPPHAHPIAEDLPEPLRVLYHQPNIAAARQRTLFVRYNYLKFKAQQIRSAFHRPTPRARELDRFETLINEARHIRAALMRTNLVVVLSVARRHLIGEPAAQGGRLLELLETGQQVLLEAIENYNASWSHTFASYLTNRLLKHFAQTQEHSPTGPPDADTTTSRGEAVAKVHARRRRSAEQIHQRLVNHARAHGIELGDPTIN